jgi:hypothetical protein
MVPWPARVFAIKPKNLCKLIKITAAEGFCLSAEIRNHMARNTLTVTVWQSALSGTSIERPQNGENEPVG